MFAQVHGAQGARTAVPMDAVLRGLGTVAAPVHLPTTAVRGDRSEGGGSGLSSGLRDALEVLRERRAVTTRALAGLHSDTAHTLARLSLAKAARAISRDLSMADHPDHTVLALHTLECLPDDVLLDMAVEPQTDARISAALEHVLPVVRSAAVSCVSGAWLRAWKLFSSGGLRGRVSGKDDGGGVAIEGDVRQLACDRIVAVWKKILGTKDRIYNVVAAAFEAMGHYSCHAGHARHREV